MNKEWSEKNKKMQTLTGKEATFREGIDVLLELRDELFQQITSIVNTYPPEAFYQMPFPKAEGYHSKTLAYSMWHIFRIEDIVAHTIILRDSQILFTDGFLTSTGSPIITTGNELKGEEIAAFSKQLDVKVLAEYCAAVKASTDAMLKTLEYRDLKRKFTDEDKKRVTESHSVSTDEAAFWLIDYWCDKDLSGLIRMPFSRHWIMHIEAMCRIKNKLCQNARKGVDTIAYCGLSCDHCFLGAWCGSCRTRYNTCSYAACCPGGVCTNAACCRERGIDGCYDCEDLTDCEKGFYANGNDGNAVKALAQFIRKHGKIELTAVMDHLHKKYDFQKIQEIIGYDREKGLRILEEAMKDQYGSDDLSSL